MEQKAREVLKVDPRYTDDIALRLEYFNRSSRSSSMPHGRESRHADAVVAPRTPEVQKLKASTADEVRSFAGQARSVMLGDEQRLRAIQNEDGSWGFNPDPDGREPAIGRGIRRTGSDPSPLRSESPVSLPRAGDWMIRRFPKPSPHCLPCRNPAEGGTGMPLPGL